MTRSETLDPGLVFEADGHLTEAVLTCLADGEVAAVPAAALAHVDGCEVCGARLGEAALRSIAAGEALIALAAQAPVDAPTSAPAKVEPAPEGAPRRPFPAGLIAAALVIAAVAAVPGWMDGAAFGLSEGVTELVRSIPFAVRALRHLARASTHGAVGVALPWAAAVVLIGLGILLARARYDSARRGPLQEGV